MHSELPEGRPRILLFFFRRQASDLVHQNALPQPVAELRDAVAVAVVCNGHPSVTFASFGPACSGAVGPSTWDAVISDARAPAVAVGPGGTVFKAYVDASSNVLFLAP